MMWNRRNRSRSPSPMLADCRETPYPRVEPKLPSKQRRFVAAKAQNPAISDREAARQAGYSPSTVHHTDRNVVAKPAVQATFRALFNEAVTDEQLIETIKAGLLATTTE